MSVVKNLIVRIGADVRGVVSGMKTAYSSTRQATSQIKNATAGMKQSVKESFSGSRASIREYREAMDRLKVSHQTQIQNTERLQDKLEQLQVVYDSLKTATDGLDMSMPLSKQIDEAYKKYVKAGDAVSEYRQELLKFRASDYSKDDRAEKLLGMQKRLRALTEDAAFAKDELNSLKQVASAIDAENLSLASASGMENLQAEIRQVQEDLNVSETMTGELGAKLHAAGVGVSFGERIKSEFEKVKSAAGEVWKAITDVNSIDPNEGIADWLVSFGWRIREIPVNVLHSASEGLNSVAGAIRRIPEIPGRIVQGIKSIGAAAGSAARVGVAQLWSNMKKLAVDGARGLITLPVKLLNIRKSAESSNGGLEKMVRSIRNIGIVALGMRVFRGIFGELRGLISNYISQNEELNATVTSMKNQLGQALEPAITAIIAAMQRLMPVIQTIASVINSVFTTLFGKIKSTTSGIQSSASAAKSAADKLNTYSFDQINKESDSSDSTASETNTAGLTDTPAWMNGVLGWIDQIKAAFQSGDWKGLGKILGDGVNSAIDAINAEGAGSKAAAFINNLFDSMNSALATVDFKSIGKKAGEFVTSGFREVNWNMVGETIGRVFTAIPSMVIGFIQNTDWGSVGKSLSTALGSMMTTVGNWYRSVDWLRIGDNIWQFIRGIDYGALASGLFSFMGSALRAGIDVIIGFINGVWSDITAHFRKWTEECGGNAALGFLAGVGAALADLYFWVKNNIVDPFLNSFTTGFGIHSPSTVMYDHGGNVIKGFLNGLLAAFGNIGSWLSTNIVQPFLSWITSLFGITDQSSTLKGLGSSLIGGLLDGMMQSWASIETFLDTKLGALTNQFTQGCAKIRAATTASWKEIGLVIVTQIQSARLSAGREVESLRQQLVAHWAGILSDGTTSMTQMEQSAKAVFHSMRTEGATVFTNLRGDLARIWASITLQQNTELNAMTALFTKSYAQMQTTAEYRWKEIQKVITEKTSNIKVTIDDFRRKLSDDFSYMNIDVSNAMTLMVGNMSNGFINMLAKVQKCINSVIWGVRDMSSAVVEEVAYAANVISNFRYSGRSSSSSSSSSSGGYTYVETGYSGRAMATGGVVNGPTRALIGEAGKEVVLPLERNTGWAATLAQYITSAGGSERADPMVFKFYLGGRKVSEYVIKDINTITQTTGICPINV